MLKELEVNQKEPLKRNIFFKENYPDVISKIIDRDSESKVYPNLDTINIERRNTKLSMGINDFYNHYKKSDSDVLLHFTLTFRPDIERSLLEKILSDLMKKLRKKIKTVLKRKNKDKYTDTKNYLTQLIKITKKPYLKKYYSKKLKKLESNKLSLSKKDYELKEYIKLLELQKSGNLHYHIIFIFNQNVYFTDSEKSKLWNNGFIKINTLKTSETKFKSYFTKYFNKHNDKSYQKDYYLKKELYPNLNWFSMSKSIERTKIDNRIVKDIKKVCNSNNNDLKYIDYNRSNRTITLQVNNYKTIIKSKIEFFLDSGIPEFKHTFYVDGKEINNKYDLYKHINDSVSINTTLNFETIKDNLNLFLKYVRKKEIISDNIDSELQSTYDYYSNYYNTDSEIDSEYYLDKILYD